MNTRFAVRDILDKPVDIEFSDPPQFSAACCNCKQLSLKMFSDNCDSKHLFCNDCVENKRTRCPARKFHRGTELKEDAPISKIIQALTVYCIHKNKGCEHYGDLDKLKAHLESDCEFHPFRCTLCRKDFARFEKEEHNSWCITKNTRCEGCGKGIPNGSYKTHLSKCPEVTLRCELCSSKHLRRDVQAHKKECPGWQCDDCKNYVKDASKAEHFKKCPEYFTLCPYCKQYESKKGVENHLETCDKNPHLGNNSTQGNQGEAADQLNHYQTGKHTGSPERKCAELEKEIAELKEKLKKTEAKAKDAEKLEHENTLLKQEVDSLKTKLHENQVSVETDSEDDLFQSKGNRSCIAEDVRRVAAPLPVPVPCLIKTLMNSIYFFLCIVYYFLLYLKFAIEAAKYIFY